MEPVSDFTFSVLFEISSAVVHERDIHLLLDKILEILTRKMGILQGAIRLRQDDLFVVAASCGLHDAKQKSKCYRLGESVVGRVAASGTAELLLDVDRDKRFLGCFEQCDRSAGIAFLCVPLFRNKQVVGTLDIACESSDEDALRAALQLLEKVGSLTAQAVAARERDNAEQEALLAENQQLRKALDKDVAPDAMVGSCRAMQKIFALLRQVAPSDATVLIRGRSGTGKELVAKTIQRLSGRAKKPFVVLNCTALPEGLLESELFGHERGAFTGAHNRRIGRAEAADGGTLFLDEIGVLTLPVQMKLLRFIQNRAFSRVGGNSEIKTDVRLLVASSCDLEELLAAGKFREDLYYRLNIFPIILPDLKNRLSDIILLAEHFLANFNIKYKKNIRRLTTSAIDMLMSYHWPGNVRELENCIDHAVRAATDDCVHGYNLPASLQNNKEASAEESSDGVASFNTLVASYERELLVESLQRNNGNMSAAGRELGLSARVMHYKINQYEIMVEQFKKS